MKRSIYESPIHFHTGDLLKVPDGFIVHQCNCLTVRSHGLSTAIFKQFPEADIYSKRTPLPGKNQSIPADRDTPGTCIVIDRVVNMLGQWCPGKPGAPYVKYYPAPPNDLVDSFQQRETWFQEALLDLETKLSKDRDAKDVVLNFPDHIGCGLGKGNWERYLAMLTDFAERNTNFTINVWKYEN